MDKTAKLGLQSYAWPQYVCTLLMLLGWKHGLDDVA